MALRILAVFLLLFSILFLPFWISAVLALAGTIYFTKFYEAAALFFLSDILYGVREEKFFGMIFVSFLISLLGLMIIEGLKTKLKFYP